MANPTRTTLTVPAAPNATVVLQTNSGTVLTVGAGMEFATLKDALAASSDGDTIAVKAGTYVNDFATVSTNVKIVAVGGMVNEVATTQPTNGKAILTVDDTLSIQGFTFSGGTDNSMWGNIAGLRLESGSLNVSYCYFHDNENGILTNSDPTATVNIDHSEFAHNGSGDGLTHNLYVGEVAALNVTNSYFHDAVVGHEIKSRAAITTITNNVIADGPNGTASYDIDLPNGGVARIAGNVLEKGANASNWYVVHYGGETQYAYGANSLDVDHNIILNDMPIDEATVVLNQSGVNGLSVSANLTNNQIYGFDPARIFYGPGTETGDTTLTHEPAYSQASPWTGAPVVGLAPGPSLLNLHNMGHTVTGGAGALTINDNAGSNTIAGGAGGVTVNVNAAWDVITTRAGATDVLNLAARGAVVNAAGNDQIRVTADYDRVNVSGHATVTGSAFDSYGLNGAGEKLITTCSGIVTAGSAADASIVDLGGDLQITLAAGGRLLLSDQAMHGATQAGVLVSNGAATGWVSASGTISLVTGDTGARVQVNGGAVSVTGGAGADTLIGGAGTDKFSLGGGADQVAFGSGAASVTGGTGADTYIFRAGAHGTATITGFKQGVDTLRMVGFSGTPIASGAIVGGSTLLCLADGTTIDLVGVALPGYGPPTGGSGGTPPSGGSGGGTPPSGGSGGGTPPSGGSGGGTPPSGSNTITLSTSGQSVTGGAAALTVVDLAGGNTVAGGAGGVSVTANTADLISTAPGTIDQISLSRYDTLAGAGADQVTASANGNVITEAGQASVTLQGTGNLVTGGAGQLVIGDSVDGNTVIGGSGGIVASMAGTYDSLTTQANAADTVSLGGKDVLNSAGRDQITVSGSYNQVTVTGAASLTTNAGWGTYDLEGNDTMNASGGASVTVGQHATATVASAGNDGVGITKLAGGSLAASLSLPGGLSTLNVSGGAATINAAVGSAGGLLGYGAGGVSFVAGSGAATIYSAAPSGSAGDTVQGGAGSLVVNANGSQGIDIVAGAGNVTLNGGTGNDVFVGGAGQAQLNLGAGADTVTLGHGAMTVAGGTVDSFVVPNAADGTLVVQNWTAQDSIETPGLPQPAIVSDSVLGGSTFLTLAGGAHIELVGITHFS